MFFKTPPEIWSVTSSNPCQLPVLLHKTGMSFIKEMDFIGGPQVYFY